MCHKGQVTLHSDMSPAEMAKYEDNGHTVCTDRLIKFLNIYVILYQKRQLNSSSPSSS